MLLEEKIKRTMLNAYCGVQLPSKEFVFINLGIHCGLVSKVVRPQGFKELSLVEVDNVVGLLPHSSLFLQ